MADPVRLTDLEPLLLTVDETAASLRLSRAATYRLIMTGDLPSIRLGGCRRVPLRDLRSYLDQLGEAGR